MASWRWRFQVDICKSRFVLGTSCLRKQYSQGPCHTLYHPWGLFISFCFTNLFFLIYLFIYLFLAVLSLRCCTRTFSSRGERGLLFIAVRGLLIAVASLFFFNKCIFFFIYFWLRWVFVAARGLSLVAASEGCSSLRCMGFSLRWILLLQSTGSRHAGFSSCGTRAQ